MHLLTVSYNEQVIEDGWIGQFSPNKQCRPFVVFLIIAKQNKTRNNLNYIENIISSSRNLILIQLECKNGS